MRQLRTAGGVAVELGRRQEAQEPEVDRFALVEQRLGRRRQVAGEQRDLGPAVVGRALERLARLGGADDDVELVAALGDLPLARGANRGQRQRRTRTD